MKKKALIVISICTIALIGTFAVSVYAASINDKPETKLEVSAIDAAEEQIDVRVDYSTQITEYCKDLDKSLTNEQIEGIARLYRDQNIDPRFTRMPYQEGIITGEVDPNAPKLDLITVKDIIARSNSFEDIMSEISEIQEYPDAVGGSGMSFFVYDFDERGGLMIIYEQQEINYQSFNADGTLKSSETLFG